MTAAEHLKKIREQLNLSPEEIGPIIKLSPEAYVKAEAGTEAVDLGWWPLIARWIAEYRGKTSDSDGQ